MSINNRKETPFHLLYSNIFIRKQEYNRDTEYRRKQAVIASEEKRRGQRGTITAIQCSNSKVLLNIYLPDKKYISNIKFVHKIFKSFKNMIIFNLKYYYHLVLV